MSDRLVNIRMNADLSQTIQQFNLLNQSLTNLRSTMSSVGMGGGGGIGMGGGGGTGMALGGGGGFAPSGAGGMPGTGRQIASGTNSTSSIGRPGGRDVTSMMFGLSQIGFALEDYQFAGWRGVMNNVPWIANSLTSLVAPAMAPYALLGTAIGVPLANMAYQNMTPEQQMRLSQSVFGGAGASFDQLSQMRLDQMRMQMNGYGTLDYRRTNMEFALAREQQYERDRTAALSYAANFNNPSADMISQNKDTYFEFANMQRQTRTFSMAESAARGAVSSFSRDDYDTARGNVNRELGELGTFGYAMSRIGSFGRNLYEGGKWQIGIQSAETNEQMRRISAAMTKLQEKKKQAYDDWLSEFGKLERGDMADWSKMEASAKIIGNADLINLTQKLKAEYKAARQTMLQDRSEQETATEEDMLFFQQMAEEDKITGRKTSAAGSRYSSQIDAIVAGSTSGEQARSRVKEFLTRQEVDKEAIQNIASLDFEKGVQDAMDNRPGSDEQIWRQNSAQWIATVKSDLLQAQKASWVSGRFRQKVFDSYVLRIKTKIKDDLSLSGISRKKVGIYAQMIFDAAYKSAQESYQDAFDAASNSLQVDGRNLGITPQQINNSAMQSLAGQMSDDLTAVYGNAQTNSFMLNRMYQQQLRRNQILMNRFMR